MITVNRQKPQNLTVNLQNRQNLTVNRQSYTPIETLYYLHAALKELFSLMKGIMWAVPLLKSLFLGGGGGGAAGGSAAFLDPLESLRGVQVSCALTSR